MIVKASEVWLIREVGCKALMGGPKLKRQALALHQKLEGCFKLK